MDKETADKVRGMVRRVTLKNVKDDGETQTASVEVSDGIWRDDVEIMHPYGLISRAPEDGAVTTVLSAGGDEGDMIALPPSNPSKRMGNVPEGAVGLANEHGDKFIILPDGTIDVVAGAAVNVRAQGVTWSVSSGGVDIVGGKVTHNGVDIGSTHTHGGVLPGGGTSGPPNN